MANLLQATVVGRLTKEPYKPDSTKGDPYALLSLAVNHGSGDDETTTFVDVAVYGKQAETVLNTLDKGDEILVVGRAELRTFDTKEGQATVLKVFASTVQFLKVKAWEKNGSGQASRDNDGGDRTPRNGGGNGGRGNGGYGNRGNGSYGNRGNGSRSGSGRGF